MNQKKALNDPKILSQSATSTRMLFEYEENSPWEDLENKCSPIP